MAAVPYKRVPELSRWLGALDWLGASAPTSAPHAINVVMQRQPWQLKLGAGTQEHQRLQRLNGLCKLLHLRRPGVAAPSRKCCDPGRARESESLETTLSLPTVNSRYLYMRSYS